MDESASPLKSSDDNLGSSEVFVLKTYLSVLNPHVTSYRIFVRINKRHGGIDSVVFTCMRVSVCIDSPFRKSRSPFR